MTVLILAAGMGTRIGRKTDIQNKCMLKIKGKPILYYNLEHLLTIKDIIQKIIIVVNYKKETIIDYFGSSFHGIPITYVIQKKLDGIVGAIISAQDHIKDDCFLLMLGDEIIVSPRFRQMYSFMVRHQLDGLCGVLNVEDNKRITKTYSLKTTDNNFVIETLEKPKVPYNNLMGTGYCMFYKETLNYLKYTPVNTERNQRELCSWINICISNNMKFKPFKVCKDTININYEEDIEAANALL